ncbi:MAG: carboxypeptidase regulatory-like domain-containing protein [Verrucomicrobiota bacterium]|nr:carboxypeptidase regulatory-like domain-containing protein [Verrucomicrobiota bacterium]
MKSKSPIVLLCLFSLLNLVVFSTQLRGQGVTSSSLGGTVTDASGAPVTGAEITAVDTSSGTRYTSVTRAGGRFDISNVRTGGPYRVTASANGTTKSKSGVFTTLSETAEVDLQLGAGGGAAAADSGTAVAADTGGGATTERVVVQGTAVDDLYSSDRNGTSTYVTRENINNLPTINRSLNDYIRLTPQISTLGRAGASVAGQNNRSNNIQIDGATTSDAFGLATAGGGTGSPTESAEPISLDTIDQFRVNIAPYDVRESNFQGASINAITRSGDNQFHGSIYGYGRDERLVGDGSRNQPVGAFHEYTYGVRLGGPIIQDKLFFFASYEAKRALFPINGDTSRFNLASVQNIIDITENKYGFNPGGIGDASQTVEDDKYFVKLDWNFLQGHRLSARYNHVDGFNQFGLSRGTTYDLDSRQYDKPIKTDSIVAELFDTWSPSFSTEARVGYNFFQAERVSHGFFPSVNVHETFGDVRFGSEQFSQQNSLKQEIIEATANADYFIGNHQITLGTNNELIEFKNKFLRDFYGAYDFRAAFGKTATQNYLLGQPSNYSLTVPTIPGTTPVTEVRQFDFSGYLQDKWKVTPNITLSAGIRVDTHIFPDDPFFNPNFAAAFPGRSTSEIPNDVVVSPRLGFNWDVFGDKTTQMRGGVGIFGGRTLGVLYTNQYGGTGVDFQRTTTTFTAARPGFFSPDPLNQPPAGRVLAPEIDLTDTNFESPQIARSSFAIDQKLPFNLIATVEGLYAKTLVGVTEHNLNLGPLTGFRPEDGRPIYGGFNANKNFDRVILLTNTSQGHTYNITAQLERPNPGDGWTGKLAYTYGRAFDVNSTTSSQAASNFGFNPVAGNPNKDTLSTSDFELRHRILGVLSYTHAFRKGWDSTIGLVYQGEAGKPYSVLYNGDLNGDGQFGNDLIYVPTGVTDPIGAKFAGRTGETAAANFAAFNNYIEHNDFLKDFRGRIAPRNGGRDPWINHLDLHFSQKIPVKFIDAEFTVDVLNLTNLIDSSKGQLKRYSGFGTPQPVVFNSTTQKYTFNPAVGTEPTVQSIDDLESRWRVQLGMRLSF